MAAPKSKSELLSKTTQSYCKKWLKEQLYCREYEFSNKYIQKGLIVEDNAIDLIAEQIGYGLLFKNEKFFENEYIKGTPDVIVEKKDTVIDAKSSWDVFTFPFLETEIPSKDYYWQGQGYLDLTGLTHYKLSYALVDTPENLIESEMRKHAHQNGYDVDDMNYEEWHKKMTFRDIPNEMRVKVFEFDKCQSDIDKVYQRVEECREYLDFLVKQI